MNADEYSQPLKGMHIIVDAGNGNGGFFEKILKSLGAKTEGSQFLEPDGHFPNHIPKPGERRGYGFGMQRLWKRARLTWE